MLFLLPDFTGKDGGKQLVLFAINELGADKVDVNEQNVAALNFTKNAVLPFLKKQKKIMQEKLLNIKYKN
jgi:hypothetical protein